MGLRKFDPTQWKDRTEFGDFKTEKLKDRYQLWDVIKDIFRGKPIDTNVAKIPAFLIIKMMSFDRQLATICDRLNYFFPIDDQEWMNLLVVAFSGKRKFLNIVKKTKDNNLELEFQKRVQKYYSWSKVELGKNYDVLVKMCDIDFLQKLGFTDDERDKIMDIIK